MRGHRGGQGEIEGWNNSAARRRLEPGTLVVKRGVVRQDDRGAGGGKCDVWVSRRSSVYAVRKRILRLLEEQVCHTSETCRDSPTSRQLRRCEGIPLPALLVGAQGRSGEGMHH